MAPNRVFATATAANLRSSGLYGNYQIRLVDGIEPQMMVRLDTAHGHQDCGLGHFTMKRVCFSQ